MIPEVTPSSTINCSGTKTENEGDFLSPNVQTKARTDCVSGLLIGFLRLHQSPYVVDTPFQVSLDSGHCKDKRLGKKSRPFGFVYPLKKITCKDRR